MKVVIFGSNGFIGRAVAKELSDSGHEVFNGTNLESGQRVDLLDIQQIETYLRQTNPVVIINCAGIVDQSGVFDNNRKFSENIIKAAQHALRTFHNIIIIGSAGEYGEVESLPVTEGTKLRATSPYALSKIDEEQTALELSTPAVPVTVARVFNPLGTSMKEKFLVPGLIRQIHEITQGVRKSIEVNRLDSTRDYVDVRDIAVAIRLLAEHQPKHRVYNIGSGKSTTNGEVLELLLTHCGITEYPQVIESSGTPEPQIASQADISLMRDEFKWNAEIPLSKTIKDIVDATK